MRMHIESYRYAADILEHRFAAEWQELLQVLGTIDPPLRPVGPYSRDGRPKSPKRQMRRFGGVRANILLPVDQSALNHTIDESLVSLGWNRQPYILVGPDQRPIDTRLKGDFERNRVFVEVEFGNVASLYRDIFKFHIAGTTGAAEIGVIVVAMDDLAKFFDQGQATYETAVSLLPYMRAGLQLPTAIIGLDVNDWSAIENRYEEMRQLVEANGEACHPFDVARAIADEIDLEADPD